MVAEDGGDPGLGDAVVGGDGLGGLAGLVASGDVGGVGDGQEALGS